MERTWTNVEPGKQSLSDYPVSKKVIHLRQGSLLRDNDGAIEFWKVKDNLQEDFVYGHQWSDEVEEQHDRRWVSNKKIPVLYR